MRLPGAQRGRGMPMLRMLLLTASIGCCIPGWAADGEAHMRERIAAGRAQAEAEFALRQRECRQHFAVTPCVDAARSHRREVLGRLRLEELSLDDARRRQRVAARELRIQRKLDTAKSREREELEAPPMTRAPPQARAASSPAKADRERPMRQAVPHKASSHSARRHAPPDAATRQAARRQARDARNVAEFEARSRAVRAHRAEVERRSAERAARGRKAQPLPAPASAPER